MNFNLRKLEELPGASGSIPNRSTSNDLLFVNVEQDDGTYLSANITARELLRTGNLPLENSTSFSSRANELGLIIDVNDIKSQEHANEIILALLNLLSNPAKQKINGATGALGRIIPDDSFNYDPLSGVLSVVIPPNPLAEGGATGATGIPGIMFPNDTLEYNNSTGELGVVIPDIDLAEGGATGATGIPGIMFPNDTLEYNNSTGELGVSIPPNPLAEGGATGATGIPGIMFPNKTLDYDNSTGELGVTIPPIPLAVQEANGSTGIPGTLYPNNQFTYDSTGKLGIELATQTDAITGATGIPGVMFPDNTLRYNPVSGELGVDIPAGTKFVGVIGTGAGQVIDPTNLEDPGDFYIVAESLNMTVNWPPIPGATLVEIGDIVILDDTGDWSIVPGVFAMGILGISGDDPVQVDDTTNPKYPLISVDEAVGGISASSGLLSATDKIKLDLLDPSAYLINAISATDALVIEFPTQRIPKFSIDNAVGATGPGDVNGLDGFISAEDQNKLDNLDLDGYLTGATSSTPSLTIDFTDPQEPDFSISNSVGATGPNDVNGLDGLISADDQNKLDNLDLDGYLTGATSSTSALTIDFTDPQEPDFSVDNAIGATGPGDVNGLDGFISAEDQNKIDTLDITYVKQVGDTMTGNLVLDGPSIKLDYKQGGSINTGRNNTLNLTVGGMPRFSLGQQLSYFVGRKVEFRTGNDVVLNVDLSERLDDCNIRYYGQIVDDNDLVTKKYVNDEDTIIKNDVTTLQEEIDILRQTQVRGEFTYGDPRGSGLPGPPQNSGEYYLLKLDNTKVTTFSEVKYVGISKTDISGISHTFGDIDVDDIISIFDKSDDGFGSYQIVQVVDDGSDHITYEVDVLSSIGSPNDIARVFFYKALEDGSVSDIYLEKTGDTMTGILNFDGISSVDILFKKDGKIAVDKSKELKLGTGTGLNFAANIEIAASKTDFGSVETFYGGSITEEGHITNKKFTDETYVNVTGDSMTGNLLFQELLGEIFEIGSFESTKFKIINRDGLDEVSIIEYDSDKEEVSIPNLRTPVSDTDAANKKYVDDISGEYLPLSGGTLTGQLQLDRIEDNTHGLVIKGVDEAGAGIDLLSVYHNSGAAGAVPDAVNYMGRVDQDSNIINKKALADYTNTNYLKLSGGTLTGTVTGTRFKANASGSARVIEAQQDASTTFWVNANGQARTNFVINSGDAGTTLTTKDYVDGLTNSAMPVGTVVMWFGTNAPSGWLKCDGSTFNTTTYSALHTHLGSVPNYTNGVLPNFQGLYPGGAGSGHDNSLTSGGQAKTNTYHVPKTGQPSGGAPYENYERPTNAKSGFSTAGNTKALIDDNKSKVTINTGWDAVTRPPTLSVHFIIKT